MIIFSHILFISEIICLCDAVYVTFLPLVQYWLGSGDCHQKPVRVRTRKKVLGRHFPQHTSEHEFSFEGYSHSSPFIVKQRIRKKVNYYCLRPTSDILLVFLIVQIQLDTSYQRSSSDAICKG